MSYNFKSDYLLVSCIQVSYVVNIFTAIFSGSLAWSRSMVPIIDGDGRRVPLGQFTHVIVNVADS